MAIIKRDSDQLEIRRRQSDLAFKTMESLNKEEISMKLDKRMNSIQIRAKSRARYSEGKRSVFEMKPRSSSTLSRSKCSKLV